MCLLNSDDLGTATTAKLAVRWILLTTMVAINEICTHKIHSNLSFLHALITWLSQIYSNLIRDSRFISYKREKKFPGSILLAR
jgi:hypothetical protein